MTDYDSQSGLSNKEVRLIELKAKCSHYDCGHTALKCIKCGKWEDNLNNELVAQVEVLKSIVAVYEELLYYNGIEHITYSDLLDKGIIDLWVKHKYNYANNWRGNKS
jgi:hypothetical protein